MDTLEIVKVMRGHSKTNKYFKGVFASDKLPHTKVKRPSCFIINTDPSTKPGTHWVAIYFPNKGKPEYFDSFGLKPKIKSILSFISRDNKGFTYNRKQLQNVFSTVCGNYCCEYLLHRCQGKSKSSFLKKYDTRNTFQHDATTIKNFNMHFKKNKKKSRISRSNKK